MDTIQDALDIHNHFLPGIDDGSTDIETSQDMLHLYKNLGFNEIITTPHVMKGYYNNNSSIIKNKLEEIRSLLVTELQNFAISTSAEYMVDDHFEELINNNDLLLFPKNHLLMEQSYAFPSLNFDQIIFQLRTQDIQPIFAHPERYVYLQTLADYDFARKTCKFQLNALSLGLHYGKAVRQKAYQLLENQDYHFIGTDAHRPEHLQKLKDITLSKKHVDLVQALWNNNEELRN